MQKSWQTLPRYVASFKICTPHQGTDRPSPFLLQSLLCHSISSSRDKSPLFLQMDENQNLLHRHIVGWLSTRTAAGRSTFFPGNLPRFLAREHEVRSKFHLQLEQREEAKS